MRLEPGTAMVTSGGAGGTDPVEAARSWLREHGVEAVPEVPARPGRRVGPHEPGAGAASTTGPAGSETGPGSGDRDGRDARLRQGDGSTGGPRGRRRRSDGTEARARDGDPDGAGRRDVAEGRQADPDADPEEVARRIVLRKLSAQARTRAELERALKSKAVPAEAAGSVLDRMGEVGLVDDAAFARDWVASRQQRRHLSRTALRRELQTKGVDREVIDEALADVEGADEHRAALDLARRRAASMAALPREVAYRRLGGVLARRGFSSSVTTRVLAEVLGDWAED